MDIYDSESGYARRTNDQMTTTSKSLPRILLFFRAGMCSSVSAQQDGDATKQTAIGELAASMAAGQIKELDAKNRNHDLFKMWYDWEEEDIKRYGSQKMFNIICRNNDNEISRIIAPAAKEQLRQKQELYNTGHFAAGIIGSR